MFGDEWFCKIEKSTAAIESKYCWIEKVLPLLLGSPNKARCSFFKNKGRGFDTLK